MNSFQNIIPICIAFFFLEACTSNEVTPDAALIQPKTMTVVTYNEVNPTRISYTWNDNLITSFVVKTLNTATKQDFIRKYDISRNEKQLIQSILYTYEGGGFPDGNTVQNYNYSNDNTQISYLSTIWKYNDSGNLANLIYWSRAISGFVEYNYNNLNQLTKMSWVEQPYFNNVYTIGSYTNLENPLYNIAKSNQFLTLSIDNVELAMSESVYLPKSYDNGLVDNFVIHEVDAQNRVNSITISNNGIILKKYTFTY